jgi:hypothetical protein
VIRFDRSDLLGWRQNVTGDRVLFAERANELVVTGLVKVEETGAAVKARVNPRLSVALDPKLSELSMVRLKRR